MTKSKSNMYSINLVAANYKFKNSRINIKEIIKIKDRRWHAESSGQSLLA